MMIQKHSCTGAFLSIDQPYVLTGQIFKSPNAERIFGSGYKSKVAIKKIDHDGFDIRKIRGKKRDIVFIAFSVQEMGPSNIRIAHVQGFQSICAPCIGREDIELRI